MPRAMRDPDATHCADTFDPDTLALCGIRRNERTRSASEFDAADPEQRCDVCRAQRDLIVANRTT